MRLRTQLLCVMLLAGTLALLLFLGLWTSKWTSYNLLSRTPWGRTVFPDLDEFFDTLREEAVNYDLPKDEGDAITVQQLQPFLYLGDSYTGIYIYGASWKPGLFLAGSIPDSLLFVNPFSGFFSFGYAILDDTGLRFGSEIMPFRNGNAEVLVYLYQPSLFMLPYFLFSIAGSILLFFWIVLRFISRKIHRIRSLEQEVLRMSSGDLGHPVPACGNDEIGTLAVHLDQLRRSLATTIRQEQESRQANQDLITAMSHDLRTPLTILNGYLEVVRLDRRPQQREEYLERCLQKTDEIRQLTDRMFEYALVYEESETATLTALPCSLLLQCLRENADYIRLTGFALRENGGETIPEALRIWGDEALIRRVLNNLFSNIIKYGDKKQPVTLCCSADSAQARFCLSNAVKADAFAVESNHIGLRSVRKMMELMNGTFATKTSGNQFLVTLVFQVVQEET